MCEWTIDMSLPISDDCGDKGRSKRRLTKRYADEDRQRVFELYRSGKRKTEVSRLLGIPETTLRGWLKQAVTAGVINHVSTDESSNASSSEGSIGRISGSAGELREEVTDETILPDAMDFNNVKPTESSCPEDLTAINYAVKRDEMNGANVDRSTPDSTSEKRKQAYGESPRSECKRRKTEVTEPVSNVGWQQSSFQALSSMSPSSSFQQQPAALQSILKPKPIISSNFHQQPTPTRSSALPGHPQNVPQTSEFNISSDPNTAYYQQLQLMSFYQNFMLAQQQQLEQQQLQQSQQPNASYYNHQPQQVTTPTYSMNPSQVTPSMLSTAVTTPKGSTRGKKRRSTVMSQPNVAQHSIHAYQEQLNRKVLQNILYQGLQQQQIKVPASLQITPVGASQTQTPPTQISTVPLQNPAPNRPKSRSETASPLSGARSPLPSSFSPLSRGLSPLSCIQSPLKGTYTPPFGSSPNPYWQPQEEQQQPQQPEQQQQQEQQNRPYEHQQNQQLEEHRQNGHEQQREEQEPGPDSAYQSQDSQSSSGPPSQLEKPSSPDHVENVDGFTCDDSDVGQLIEVTILRAPTSIMNPLEVKGKRKAKKKVDEVAVCANGIANVEPADGPRNYSVKESERIKEEFVGEFLN